MASFLLSLGSLRGFQLIKGILNRTIVGAKWGAIALLFLI